MPIKFNQTNITMSGVANADYNTFNNDTAIFFKNKTTITPKNDFICVYYVIAGGGKGGNGNTPRGVYGGGGGGGGGQVRKGVIHLMKDVTYVIDVASVSTSGSGKISAVSWNVSGKTYSISANGGEYGNKSGFGIGGEANSGGGSNYSNTVSITAKPGSNGSSSSGGNGGMPGIPNILGSAIMLEAPGLGGRMGTLDGKEGGVGCGGGGGFGPGLSGNGGPGGVYFVQIDNTDTINELETKMKELHQLPGTRVEQLNQQYNATMVAGAMWTVLATSLVYYVFTQL